MKIEDGKTLDEKRAELIVNREQRLQQLVEERKLLARNVFAMMSISGALTRLPPLSAINEEQFQQHMDAYPMTTETIVSFGAYNSANLPSEDFLLGPMRNRPNSNMIIPSLKVSPYSDDSENEDEAMDVEFNSKYPLKINWTKASREDPRTSRPPLFASNYVSALPTLPPQLLKGDLSRQTESSKQTVKKEHGSNKENQPQKPIDFNRWQATLTHNPTYKLVRKASKCLTTKDWNTSIQELVLFRAFERIDELRNANMWSFRQPKRQTIPQAKDHWSYLLDEVKWMQADFREERKWKMALAQELAQAVTEYVLATPKERAGLRGYYKEPEFPEPVEPIERGVPQDELEDVEMPENPEKPETVVVNESDSSEEDDVQVVIQPKESDKEGQAMDAVKDPEPVFVKTEEPDQSNLENLPKREDEDRKPDMIEEGKIDESKNPILYIAHPDSNSATEKVAVDYQGLRNPITKLDGDALWVDSTELEAVAQVKKEEAGSMLEWDSLLPDLPVYDMELPHDIPNGVIPSHKGEVQSESIPISRFADTQPMLLGVLQPALRIQNGVWRTSDQTPVAAAEGKRPTPLGSRVVERHYLITSPKYTNKIMVSKAPVSAPWTPTDDKILKDLVHEYGFHWRLIAETFNFYRRTNSMEARTPSHCYVRYDLLWGEHSGSMDNDISMEGGLGDSPVRSTDFRNTSSTVTRGRPRAPEEFVPTAQPQEDDAKFMRHKFVHRAIKRVMKRREDEAKSRDVPHRMMVPHQSHETIMKTKFCTPQELGKLKRDAEEKRLIEMQKRRQIEMRHAQEAQRIRALQAQGHQPGMHGVLPNGVPNPMAAINSNQQLNGGAIPLAMRGPGAVPNISQQGGAGMLAAVPRGPNGEITPQMQSAMMLLQQQTNNARMAAAMANGSPPRPQSAASILSQGAMGASQAQVQAAMLARQHSMQMQNDPNFRAQMQMAQMSQMPGMAGDAQLIMFRQNQQRAMVQQQMAATAAMQQQQQQNQQNQQSQS